MPTIVVLLAALAGVLAIFTVTAHDRPPAAPADLAGPQRSPAR